MTVYLVLGTLLIALVSFAFSPTGFALLFSPLVGLLGFGFFRLLEPDSRARGVALRIGIATGIGAAAGVLLAIALGVSPHPVSDAIGALLSLVIALAVHTITGRSSSEPCTLCKAPIRGGAIECPRCLDRVCPRPSCWNAKHARCFRCHQREVVIFPIAERWWDARVGRRVMTGECSSCYKEAHEANLRECGQCRWPMCQRCWDYHNGICQRCAWTMPDLPAKLAPFMVPSRRSRRSGRSSGRPVTAGTPDRQPAGGKGSADETIAQSRPVRPGRR